MGFIAASGRLDSARSALASGALEIRSSQAPVCPEGQASASSSQGVTRSGLFSVAATKGVPATASARQGGKKPNIVIIWGDDIGQSNISAYSMGMMGYRTPNIDRVAKEGMIFTDYYAEQSCTAGRASFITGQHGLRTGMTKVGLPGSPLGLQKQDPTIAELLKPHGYATGQFGKNHLGDRNEFLPTVHGFDEFYGNLYHLNAEEEPELRDYPKDPAFRQKYGPRGVLDCKATDVDDPTVDPRFGKVGKQTIKDTGPLTKKRMETIDDDTAARAIDFIERQSKADKPFFLWVNFTHMHFRTHPKPESLGQSGRWQSEYHDAMIDHDKNVGTVLDALDRLGLADEHVRHVQHRQRPAHELLAGRGHDPVPQREELELGRRLPRALHGALAGQDQAGLGLEPDRRPPRLAPHIPGHGRRCGREGEAPQGPHRRRHDLQGPPRRRQPRPVPDGPGRQEPARVFHLLQRRPAGHRPPLRQLEAGLHGTARPGHAARLGRALHDPACSQDLQPRTDPYERADITSNTYYDWLIDHVYLLVPAQDYVGKFLMTFKDYPQRQKAASFNLDEVMEKLQEAGGHK